ncbi:hypothetical protein [Mucilaginibacter sp.]|jgi:hypothetical protein|uniref:hypothetical protein n=1 Tax=Mucilaginibacter sp. TaxID=1882438 RepID=UPI003569676D
MKTAQKNATGVQGTTAQAKKATDVKTQNRPNITGKEAKEDKKDEPVKDQKPAEAPKVEATQAAEAQAGNPATVDNQPANVAEHAEKQEIRADEPKTEVKYIKPAPNLELTLKAVDTLHRWSILRLNLIARIKQLEAFEVALRQENDELEDNPYQGCKLIIKDDKNREFVTTTPGLIRLVSQFIFNACGEKLAEIEANIVFPNA